MENYEYENGNVVYENDSIAVVEKPTKKRRFLALWIIVGVLYLATTAFMLWTFIDAKVSDISKLVGYAMNLALHTELTIDDINMFMS